MSNLAIIISLRLDANAPARHVTRAMARPTLFLDISRLIRRYEYFGGPTGIDRIELRYAQWLQTQPFLTPMPVARGRHTMRALSIATLQHIASTLERRWSSERTPGVERGGRSALRFAADRVTGRLSRWRILAGGTVPAAPGPSVYLNVGQDSLDSPQKWAGLPGAKVVLLSDIIPLTHPEYDTPRSTALHGKRVAALSHHADHVIGISAATIQDLARLVGPQRYSTSVAHLAPGFSVDGPPAAPQLDAPFIHLSTINRRKNLALLLHIWRGFAALEAAPKLVIVGRRGNDTTALEMLDRCAALRAHVTHHNAPHDGEAAELLASARALLTPSFAEGFGLPIVEAYAMGVPVIASDIPAHREVGGQAALYRAPIDGNGWREAIMHLAHDAAAHAAAVRAIPRPLTWDDHFAIVEPLLRDLAR